LGGAAVHRCGNSIVLNSALAAEGVLFTPKRLFPQPVQQCHIADADSMSPLGAAVIKTEFVNSLGAASRRELQARTVASALLK